MSRDKRKKRAMSQQLVEVFATSEDTSPIFEKKYVTGWNRKFVTGYFASYHKIPFVSNKDGPCISKWRCVINLTVYTESRWMVILHMTLWCSDLLCAYHCNLIFHPSHALCSLNWVIKHKDYTTCIKAFATNSCICLSVNL